ncbi:nucleotidyltransferase domain-containing protein [Clostridium sp. JN-1]|uniref:nucleotidyltransferase domain-containing protein n=1 Tax=Clostridium sp. JN-1 TaxID=2483110 RepID=UPI000F0B2A8E|nr:nucleotidyltransferase domain-containing protein [Clostridium sp. JN-1]
MAKTILQYQKAFNGVVNRMKKNKLVLAVMVFGSMVTGDLWDESDIDLFVILDKKYLDIQNIYTEEKGIPVHIKLMSKNKFIQLQGEDIKGSFIHRIFASSKLVFSKDMEITVRYDNERYYPDSVRERWNMVYLGQLLKNIGICKKYMHNDDIYTAYTAAVKCAEEYSKLYVNSSGHMISKDAMIMAMNLNDEFKKCVDKLFFNKGEVENAIINILNYFQVNIDKSIRDLTNVLLNYMRDRDCFLSSEDIKEDKVFSNYDINMEEILSKLWEKNIIKKETRDLKTENGIVIFKENVYFI